jgi:hypothetical protein
MKECVICNEEFEAKRKHAKYCSSDCRNKRRIKPFITKTCLHCSISFETKKNYAKYCSKICSSRKNTEENKELRWSNRTEITCRECGIVAKPVKSDGTTCGKRGCVDESRRKTKVANDIKARKKGGRRHEQYRKYQNKYVKERSKIDPMFRLHRRISAGIRYSLANNYGLKTFEVLDYTYDMLKEHIESQFTEGMSWSNKSKWHLDHIKPASSFNFDSIDHPDFKKCWALENLQPLWAKDNMSKGNKWEEE